MENIDYKKLSDAIAFWMAKWFFLIIMVYILITVLIFIPLAFLKSEETCLRVWNLIECEKWPDSKNEINIL